MKRTVYTDYSMEKMITVESTPYKDGFNCRIWTDGTNYYNLSNSGRHPIMKAMGCGTTWVAQKLVNDIIDNASKYGVKIG